MLKKYIETVQRDELQLGYGFSNMFVRNFFTSESFGKDDPIFEQSIFLQRGLAICREMFFSTTVRTETRRSANPGVTHVPGLVTKPWGRCPQLSTSVSYMPNAK